MPPEHQHPAPRQGKRHNYLVPTWLLLIILFASPIVVVSTALHYHPQETRAYRRP
jgi:hypothetical protein